MWGKSACQAVVCFSKIQILTVVPANDNLESSARLTVEPRHGSGSDEHLLPLSVSSVVWQFMTLFLALASSEVTFYTLSLAHVITSHQQTAFLADFIFIYIQTGCRQPSLQGQNAFAPEFSPVHLFSSLAKDNRLYCQRSSIFFRFLVWPCVLMTFICTMLNCCTCSHASQCLLDENNPSNIHTCSFNSVSILTSVFNLSPESRSMSGLCGYMAVAHVDVQSFLSQHLCAAQINK